MPPTMKALATLLLLCLTTRLARADTLEKTWTLYHSLNGGQEFSKRASVVLSVDPDTDGSVDLAITNDNSTLNQDLFRAVKTPGAMYQLKLVVAGEGGGDGDFVLSSVPACQLLRANFREELILSLGTKASAISLTYIPLVSPLAPKSCDDPYWDTKEELGNLRRQGWDTRISWETATPGMVLRTVMPQYRPPPGLKWLPRLGTNGKLYQAQGPPGSSGDETKKGGAGGQTPEMDNTPMGFIRRYWYILLPLFLANFIGADPPPSEGQQQQQQGQGGGGGQQQQGGGGGAAPAAAPAAAPKQRRGKRG